MDSTVSHLAKRHIWDTPLTSILITSPKLLQDALIQSYIHSNHVAISSLSARALDLKSKHVAFSTVHSWCVSSMFAFSCTSYYRWQVQILCTRGDCSDCPAVQWLWSEWATPYLFHDYLSKQNNNNNNKVKVSVHCLHEILSKPAWFSTVKEVNSKRN